MTVNPARIGESDLWVKEGYHRMRSMYKLARVKKNKERDVWTKCRLTC